MEIATAVLTIMTSLVGLLIWWMKRRRAPTIEEAIHDLQSEYHDSTESIHRLRSLGNHAEAEAMLRRLTARSVIAHSGLRNKPASTPVRTSAERERLGSNIASRNADPKPSTGSEGGLRE